MTEYCKRCGYNLELQGGYFEINYKDDGYCSSCRIAIHDIQFIKDMEDSTFRK